MRRQSRPLERHADQPPPALQRGGMPWWRPLTTAWGIYGIIIFIGLVLSLIETAERWYAQ
jgi:hypothetical protein